MERVNRHRPSRHAKKNTACAACFQSRQKCVRKPGAASCDRCISKHRPCVKRTPKQAVRKKEPVSDIADGVAAIYQSIGTLMGDQQNYKASNVACATLVKLLPPDILSTLANYFAMRALATHHLPSLHIATSLGVKAGCTVAALKGKQVISNEELQVITEFYTQQWFGATSNPAIIAITVRGTETVYANEQFKKSFTVPSGDVACLAWGVLFEDQQVVKEFQMKWFETWLTAPRSKFLDHDMIELKYGTNKTVDSDRVVLIGKDGEKIKAHACYKKAWILPGEVFVNFLEIESIPEKTVLLPRHSVNHSVNEFTITGDGSAEMTGEQLPRDDEFADFLIDTFPDDILV